MAINKVVFGNEVKMDLTNDSVSADNLLEGETAHDRSGSPVVGTAKQGHSILDRLGTLLTQRSKLKFGGMLKTTDDSTNGVTEVSDLAEEVEWSVWNAMTEAQRTAYSAGKKLDIINVPSVSGSIPVELIKTLWTNPSPSASFAAQTITLDSDDYDFLLIVGSFVSSAPNDRISVIVPKGSGAYLSMADTNASGANNAYRCFNYTNDTTYSVLNAYSGTSSNVNNNRCIPTAIYGIKSSVNVDMSALVANVSTSASKCMLSDGETSVEDALNNAITDFALGNTNILYIPIKYTSNWSLMYLHVFGIYAGASTAFQSAISARNNNGTWAFSSTDTNISVDKLGDNLRITFPNTYSTGSYIVRYVGT